MRMMTISLPSDPPSDALAAAKRSWGKVDKLFPNAIKDVITIAGSLPE